MKERIKKVGVKYACHDEVIDRMKFAASVETQELFYDRGTTWEGLSEALVEEAQDGCGDNKVTDGKKVSPVERIAKAFVNPLTAVLFALAVVSAFADIVLAEPGEADLVMSVTFTALTLISGLLRFVQEFIEDDKNYH